MSEPNPHGQGNRRVTTDDLKPGGWVCEACGEAFAVGDEAFGNILAFTDTTPRDLEVMLTPEQRAGVPDAEWDEPIPVLGEYRCRSCFDAEREVADA